MFRKIIICAVVAGVFGVFTVGLVIMMVSTGQREAGATGGRRRGAVPSTRVANLLQNPSTRLAEAKRLGRVKDESSRHLLAHHVWKADDGEFRRTCIWALGEIGGDRAVQPLSAALDSGDTATRIAATHALRRVGGDRAALFLAQAAVRQREAAVREAAAKALAGIQGREVDVLLANAATDKEPRVRLAAVKSLMGRKSRAANNALTLALRDDDPEVRAAAAACLGETGTGPLANARAVFTREYREGDLIGVVNLLEKLRTVEVAPVLVEALDRLDAMYSNGGDRNYGDDLVKRAARVFAVQGPGIVGPLEQYAIASECSILSKRAAGEACALIGSATVEPINRRVLKWKLFPNPDELAIWVKALARIGHPGAAPTLDRAAAQEFWVPGMAALVADARRRIEENSGARLPKPEPIEIVPGSGTGEQAALRRKFRTPFGRAFFLRSARFWDRATLGMVARLTGDPAYAAKAKAGRAAVDTGTDADRLPVEVNDVTGFDHSWCGAAFPEFPDKWKPGLLWKWNRSVGVTNPASTGKVFDQLESGSDLVRAFVNYPLAADGKSWTVEPKHPSDNLPLTWQAPKYGYYCLRSGWRDENDFVAEIFTKEKDGKGQRRANAGAFRIFGLGHPWVICPADTGGFRVQEPCVVLPDDDCNERGSGRVTHLLVEPEDGSGSMAIDLGSVYGEGRSGQRAIAMDYSGKSGAPAMMVLVDEIRGGGERLWLWQLPKGKLDEVKVDGNSFSLSYDDASMKATFVSPGDVNIRATRDRVRAGRLGGRHGLFEGRLDRVKAVAPAGTSFFVVITFQRKDAPTVEVKGGGLNAEVTAGKRTIRFDNGKVNLL